MDALEIFMTDFKHIIERSMAIRAKYHALEDKHHGSRWTV